MRSTVAFSSGGRLPALAGDEVHDRVAGALAQPRPVEVHAAHAGLGAEGHEAGRWGRSGARGGRTAWPGPRSSGPRASRPRARPSARPRRARVLDTGHRQELGGLAVAERDRAGLVEQQHVHVARGLHGATGERQHVAAHQPVHARDPDRRQQRPDGRGDERDEQRDQRDHRGGGVGELGERPQGHDHHEEDQGQAREQDPSAISFGRLAPLGALHQSDHAVEEAAARLLRDLDDDAVGEHARAAGHGAAVAAGLADHRARTRR